MKTVRKATRETPENSPIILLHVLLSNGQKASSGSAAASSPWGGSNAVGTLGGTQAASGLSLRTQLFQDSQRNARRIKHAVPASFELGFPVTRVPFLAQAPPR